MMSTLKIHHWCTVSLKLDKIKKSVQITNRKKNINIDMKNYFVRKSNKYKHSLVFDSITEELGNEGKKYVFSFSQHIVGKIYDELLKCVYSCQQEKLLALMMEDNDEEKEDETFSEKKFVFLSTKNINDYLSYKEKVEKQIMQNKFDFKILFSENKLRIEQSSKI